MRGHMLSKRTRTLGKGAPLVLLLVLVALLGLGVEAIAAPQAEDVEASDELRAARGRTSYRIYCRNCHGKTGVGDGPIAELLKVPPADLTALSQKHGGEYPAEDVYQAIDGRIETRGHGSREMPIWGYSFQDPSRSDDQEAEVRERILDLVAFIRTLQK